MESTTAVHEVRDVYGRRRRVGESAEALLGHSRRRQLAAAWLCMAAISPLQYAFGLAAIRFQELHGWAITRSMVLLGVFIVCQALVAIPAAWMQRRRVVSPAQSVVVGGLLAACGLLALAHSPVLVGALLGYAIVGGVGVGLVYSQCVTTSGRWFPDQRAAAIGFVTGGFACGAVPCIVLLSLVSSRQGLMLSLDLAAVVALCATAVAGLELKDPPRNWWPPEVDAQMWAVDHQLNRSAAHNMPAVRYYEPGEAMRTGALPLMWVMLALISAVSLFGIAFVAGFAVDSGLGVTAAGVATALVAALNGIGRVVGGTLSDQFGRRGVLASILLVEGVAILALGVFGPLGGAWVFVVCAMFVGLGGGAFYTIFANLVLEYFGENSLLQNQAVLYTAKALGGATGVCAAAFFVVEVGYRPAFLCAGAVGLVTAASVRFLKQPGRPSLPVRPQHGRPAVTVGEQD
jgi:MFS family permease